jgi:hypothetical protein
MLDADYSIGKRERVAGCYVCCAVSECSQLGEEMLAHYSV